jgi:hypothetical protein
LQRLALDQLTKRYPFLAIDRPDRVDRCASDGLDYAVGTQHVDAGYDVDFAGDKACGDDRAFDISDWWTEVLSTESYLWHPLLCSSHSPSATLLELTRETLALKPLKTQGK